jgi:phage-related protein
MNEELKIIIKAVTDDARKSIQGVKKELQGMGAEGGKSSKSLAAAFKGVGVAAAAAVAAIGAIIAALVSLGNSTRQYREEQAKLNAAFLAAGSSTEQAAESYKNLYRFLGDSAKATEAAGHLAKLTTEEKALAEWTTALQGVYATFGDSLPIEGLTEAANETAKVGKVTGTLADALNWAGVNEDAFNASLAAANSEAEREALIRNTLNTLYSDAAQLYEKNNADIIAANEAQARLDATTARLGKTVQPLLTALTNLSNALLTFLAPAIQVVSNALTWLINAISGAVQWLSKFFGILSGKNESVSGISNAAAAVSSGLGGASAGAGNLASGLGAATKQAEKLKRATAGFDELNIMKSDSGSSAASGGSGAGAGGIGGGGISGVGGGFAIDTSGVTEPLDKVSGKFDEFVSKIKAKFEELKTVFAPTINAFKDFGVQIGGAIQESLPNFSAGLESFKLGFGSLLTYIGEEFIPNFVNGWSENLLPIFGDITAAGITELGKHFEWLGGLFNDIVNDLIVPALTLFQGISVDVMEGIKSGWDKTGGELLTNITTFTQGLRDTIDEFYKQFLKPVIDTVLAWVDEMWQKHLKPLWDVLVDAVLDISNNILILWNKVLKPVIDWILQKIYPVVKNVIDNVLAVLSTLISSISGIIQGVIKVIKGVIQFITGVFTGDWKKAWEGVKNIVVGIFDTIWAAIKGVINLLIDGLNNLWTGIYQAVKGVIDTIGDIVGLIGKALGKGDSWSFKMPSNAPRIPKLATGGIVVSETLARIGEGGKKEAVLPLESNTEWMDKLADKIAARNSSPSKIVLMLDSRELGWANIQSINSITKQTGQLQLTLI